MQRYEWGERRVGKRGGRRREEGTFTRYTVYQYSCTAVFLCVQCCVGGWITWHGRGGVGCSTTCPFGFDNAHTPRSCSPPLLPPSTRTCPGVDPCCFHGRGRHEQILAYNAAAQGVLQWGGEHGWFTTAIVDWNVHEYSPRDRAVITAAWAATRVNANHSAYDTLPCDILRAAKVPCHA